MVVLKIEIRMIVKIVLLGGAAVLALHSQASTGWVKGQVEFVRVHDGVQLPDWAPPKFWFTLKNVSQAGNCPKWGVAPLFVMNDRQSLSVVLAAQASGQEIALPFDDAKLSSGYCTPGYITIGNPAPLY